MPTVDAYVRHAREHGGLRDCWEVARSDLAPLDLGELVETLRELGSRRQRVGRKGRTVKRETFSLTREETVVLVRRLIDAGVSDVDVGRCLGVSQARVREIRADPGSDPHKSPDLDPAPQGVIRNKVENPTDPPRGALQALRSPDSRTCAWCSAPLPATLRADAHYCIGGKCKMAAHRARQAEAA